MTPEAFEHAAALLELNGFAEWSDPVRLLRRAAAHYAGHEARPSDSPLRIGERLVVRTIGVGRAAGTVIRLAGNDCVQVEDTSGAWHEIPLSREGRDFWRQDPGACCKCKTPHPGVPGACPAGGAFPGCVFLADRGGVA